MTTRTDRERVLRTAREVFGHESLLPGQADAIKAALDGRDVLLVSPTGSGKSLAYQLTGVLTKGPTVVVSPLLALQHDQVEKLADLGSRTRSVQLSSDQTERQHEEALERVRGGEVEFLFLAPEQLAKDDTLEAVRRLRPSLLAVDEAHCVSAWGHDFRPDYLRVGEFREELGRPPVLALTATAAGPVRDDIVERLRMEDPRLVVTGFRRDNLALSVERCHDEGDQRDRVLETVTGRQGLGIVYTRTRGNAEEYAEALRERGVDAEHYHAGLAKRRRREIHERFQDGEVGVIVATSAFGMGIDKPDIRFVVHAEVPESPDTYYQEVGRAGRDGDPAEGVLLYRAEDLSLGRFFATPVPRRADVTAVVDALAAGAEDRDEVRRRTGLGPRKLGRLLNLLDEVRATSAQVQGQALVDAVLEQAEAHRNLERSRVEMMRAYAETDRCRTQFLVGYFGEDLEEPCGHCDNCRAGLPEDAAPEETVETPYSLQDRVEHEEFGAGTVMDIEADRLTVLFEEVGYRTLDAAIVTEQGLLRKARS